jgi:predicted cupin superfamily sugar epimerase
VLHQGCAEYTLITPVPGGPPKIEVKVMGTGSGEHRQLLVGAGVWKRSRIRQKDMELAKSEEDKDRIGCLITEVVIPGFHWDDHKFMKKRDLEDMFKGVEGGEERIAEYGKYLLKD